jgi:formylglycine-generating enzyme required for sulfatase activity
MELAENPMLLTSMAIVHTKDGANNLPNQKALLYHRLVDILASKWQKEKGDKYEDVSKEVIDLLENKNKLREVLERLAYETHKANAKEAREKGENAQTVDLSFKQARDVLEEPELLGYSRHLAVDFLYYIQTRSGLFASMGGENPTFNFAHRSIQEYLAGCYMMEPLNLEYRELYKEHAAEGTYWSDAALLGAENAYASGSRSKVFGLIFELCPPNAPRKKSEQTERALLWAGQITRQLDLAEVEARSQGLSAGKDYLSNLTKRTLKIIESSKFLSHRERAEAGVTLAKLGDPRKGVMNDFLFCHIPVGDFMMGSKDGEGRDNEHPQFPHEIKQEFYMTRYPITNAQFELFVQADGYKTSKYWDEAIAAKYWTKDGFKGKWDDEVRTAPVKFREPFHLPNHPVVGVSWYEAVAYCKWLTERIQKSEFRILNFDLEDVNLQSLISNSQFEIRLPTEAQWEYAARAGMNTSYYWGNDITPNHANYNDTGIGATSAVGLFPAGENKFGLLDMSGNVWEWCVTQWQGNYKDYLKNEERLNSPEGDKRRVVRGGAFLNVGSDLRCACRSGWGPNFRSGDQGFRVVVVSSFPISHSSGS